MQLRPASEPRRPSQNWKNIQLSLMCTQTRDSSHCRLQSMLPACWLRKRPALLGKLMHCTVRVKVSLSWRLLGLDPSHSRIWTFVFGSFLHPSSFLCPSDSTSRMRISSSEGIVQQKDAPYIAKVQSHVDCSKSQLGVAVIDCKFLSNGSCWSIPAWPRHQDCIWLWTLGQFFSAKTESKVRSTTKWRKTWRGAFVWIPERPNALQLIWNSKVCVTAMACELVFPFRREAVVRDSDSDSKCWVPLDTNTMRLNLRKTSCFSHRQFHLIYYESQPIG